MENKSILDKHLRYKEKSMSELIAERTNKLAKGQNELRKKWLPEKYNPTLNKK